VNFKSSNTMRKHFLFHRTALAGTAILAGAVVLTVSILGAADWPQWRGANRDGKVAGFTAPETWPKELTQKWKVTVGTGDATPALVGDKLYVFARQSGDEITLCLDANSGKELWQEKYTAKAVSGAAARHPGPRSSPEVADGMVVTLGVAGVLSCLDATSGKLLWRKQDLASAVPQFFTAMSPILVDGLCIAHVGGKDKGSILAFELASGTQKWKFEGDGPAYGSPVVATIEGVKQVVQQTEKSLVSLAVADGKLLWQVPTPIQGRAYNSATPIVQGTTVIYTGQGKGTKAIQIAKDGDSFTSKELWSNEQVGTGYNTPVLKDGFLYGISDKGNLFCLNAKDGQTAWTDTNKLSNFASVLDAGAVLFALYEKSELIAFKPGEKQYQELARFKVAETPIYAHPVVTAKGIYVKDQDAVTLWAVE